jgi:hypothetical protein
MRPPKSPLDPIARLQDKQAADAALLLAKAIDELKGPEAEAIEPNALRPEDLAQASIWAAQARAERAELERCLCEAILATRAAREGETAEGGENANQESVA